MPWAPQTTYHGDLALAGGFDALAQGLHNYVQRERDRKGALATLNALNDTEDAGQAPSGDDQGNELPQDQVQTAGKKANTIRKLFGLYSPDQKDSFDAMSLEQLEGTLKAYSINSAMQDAAARRAEMGARLQDYAAQAEMRKQQALDDVAAGQFVNNYFQAPASASLEDKWRYAAQNTPGFGGRVVPKVIESLTRYQQGLGTDGEPVVTQGPYPGVSIISSKSGRGGLHVVTDPTIGVQQQDPLAPSYTEDPVTGARALLYGKQAITTGYNPEKAQPQFIPQHDDEGNLVGFSETDARGHSTFHPAKGQFKAVKDEGGNPLPGFYINGDKVIDTRTAMQKSGVAALGEPAPAKAIAKAGPVMPKAGEVRQGYRFKGGDPRQPANWEKVK